jgi:hypothetical protein
MSEVDLKINSKARKILVENGLDTSVLSVSTTSGAVAIRGELRKFGGRELTEREAGRMLTILESNILRSKGVKKVSFSIKNWMKKKGKWAILKK